MKKHILMIFFCLALLSLSNKLVGAEETQTCVYVKSDATGSLDGTSWTDAYTSLSDALTFASNNSDITQIWVAQGTYYPTSLAGNGTSDRDMAFVLVADVGLYGGFDGTESTLDARADTTATTTILSGDIGTANDSTDNCYHVVISAGDIGSASLNGFTISGGCADASSTGISVNDNYVYQGKGGGMYIYNSSPSLTNIAFTDNSASTYGGGLSIYKSSSAITNVTFTGNFASKNGGGLYNLYGSSVITNVTFSENTATYGGGVFNRTSTSILTNVILSGNTATNGGGMYNGFNSSPTVTNATFSENVAKYGGGMYNSSSPSTLINVSFSKNSATNGGGLYNSSCSPIITNVIFSENSAKYGGGMYNHSSSSPTITNITITGNTASYNGGGIYNNYKCHPYIYNSIIWGNTASNKCNNVCNSSGTATCYNCLIEGCGGSSSWDSDFGTDEGNNMDATDSPFVSWIDPSVSNREATTNSDYHLCTESPCIDAGNNSYVPDTITTDRDGNDRIYNKIVDMGAYEYSGSNTSEDGILYVNVTASGNNDGTSWEDAYTSLSDALANASANNKIWVAQGTYYPTTYAGDGTTDRDMAFVLVADVAVYGGFNGTETTLEARADTTGATTILSGDMGTKDDNTDNCYHVVISAGDVGTASLNGFTISGGNSNGSSTITINGSSVNRISGGGMFIDFSSPYLNNIGFANNNAKFYGGAIYNNYSSPEIRNVTFSGNKGKLGGGIYSNYSSFKMEDADFNENSAITYGGAIYIEFSSPSLTNVTFNDNSAKYGGGIYINTKNNTKPTLRNVVFINNSATNVGGGMYNRSSNSNLTDVIFSGNYSQADGGGMQNLGCSPVLTNVVFTGNFAKYGGGMNNSNSSPFLTNVTISGNYALMKGGGVYNYLSSPTSYNSISWGNTALSEGDNVCNIDEDCNPSYYNCLIEGCSGSSSWNTDFGTDGGNNLDTEASPFISWIDPSASDWEATTDGDYQLSSTSPCIDAGSNSYVPDTITTDLDGNVRIFNDVVDMGAYEYSDTSNSTDGIIYVNAIASGNNDGKSWDDAYTSLSDALTNASANDEIWVAQGTYYPTTYAGDGTSDRDMAFVLVADVSVYGGFDGSESTLEARADTTGATTILSGDIGTKDDNTDNCYHVVISSGDIGIASLNGFTITGGYSKGSSTLTTITVNNQSVFISNGCGMCNYSSSPGLTNINFTGNTGVYGGGIYNYSSSPTLTNVTFSDNYASTNGGGMCNIEYSSPKLTNITFSGNTTMSGGAIYNSYSSPTLTNVSITGNYALVHGGGISNMLSSPTLLNVTIAGNLAKTSGGGIYSTYSCDPIIYNSIIWGNTASSEGSNVCNHNDSYNNDSYYSVPVYYNCLIEGCSGSASWNTDFGTDGGYNLDAEDSPFVSWIDPSQSDWQATTDGNYYLSSGSPCIDAGSNSYVPDTITTDLDGNDRIYNDVVDLGAYEATDLLTITTQAVSNITLTTATGNGTITALGILSITAYGICWNTTGSPTISDSYTDEGERTSTGAYTSALASLTANTTYYAKAYATNSSGTSYGNEVSFTTTGNYTVTFVDYDGTTLDSQSVEYGTAASAPENPSRTGYTFTGWDNEFANITHDVTVTAQYSINSFSVTFINYDGTTLDNQSVEYGTAASAPDDPSRTGYTFTGWDKDFSNITEDVTVTAQYSINSFSVTFVDYNGTTLNNQSVEYGSAASAPDDPSRTGYTFTGWDKEFSNITQDVTVTAQYSINSFSVTFVDYDGTTLDMQSVEYGTAASAPDEPSRTSYTFTGWDKDFSNITQDLTITAQYSINSFSVTFIDYDGTTLDMQSVEYGTAASTPDDPSRTGYTFSGWDKEFSNITQDLTVTAQYSIITYTIAFVDYDGTTLNKQSVEYGSSATTPNNPSRTGYTFTGWDKEFSNITQDLTVTAQYSVNTYIVTFVDYDGTIIETQEVEYGNSANAPSDPTRAGYSFLHWDTDFSKVTTDLTVTAAYVNARYTVTFVDYDGSTLQKQSVKYGSSATKPTDPVRTGYTFTGWDSDYSNIIMDTTITAQYSVITYTITYNLNGGTNNTSNPKSYNIESETITLKDANDENYPFGGWYSNSNFSTQMIKIEQGSTGDLELWAYWEGKNYDSTIINIYPNPTTGIIHINLDDIAIEKVTLFNLKGKKLYTQSDLQKNPTIDLSNYVKGVYILKIETGDDIIIKKVVRK